MADTKLGTVGALEQDRRRIADDWYETHADWLRSILQRRLRLQRSDADDLVQDTYLRLVRTSLAGIEQPRAFLSRISLNLFRDGRRRERTRRDYGSALGTGEPPWTGPSALGEQEAALELERIVLDLPRPQRDVFVLSRFRGMSNKDIADHLGISVKTVEWRMGKAIDLCVSRLRG